MNKNISLDEGSPAAPAAEGPSEGMHSDLKQVSSPPVSKADRILSAGAWLIALSALFFAIYLGWRLREGTDLASVAAAPIANDTQQIDETSLNLPIDFSSVMPEFNIAVSLEAIPRLATLHTIIPTRSREDVIDYTVSAGDSVFGIAQKYGIEPESVLWANYDQLDDNPDMLSVDMILKIPPVDGVFYEWQEGDTVEGVAAKFRTKGEDILNWPGNDLDLVNPLIEPGTWVMIPGGRREFRTWLVPIIPRGRAGVSKSVLGAGACEGSYSGLNGGGGFIWPTANRVLSGNDFWDGHLAIDIAAGVGDPVYASDSGVVVFAGSAYGGYGLMVMIDHGTSGYQTLYAHLSRVSATCGSSVGQGQVIGYTGSTGNSTGSHLHFEVRNTFTGGFINPWFVLP